MPRTYLSVDTQRAVIERAHNREAPAAVQLNRTLHEDGEQPGSRRIKLETFFEKFEVFADTPNAVAKIRELVLQLAVQGKLVPQDPNDEPASMTLLTCDVNILEEIIAEEEQRHLIPESWAWIRFAAVGDQRLGKMLDAEKNRGELKPYRRNTNVQWMRFDLDDIKKMRVEESEADELRLQKGDLLICEGGEPGRV